MMSSMILVEMSGYWSLDKNRAFNTNVRPQMVTMILSGDKRKMYTEDFKLLFYILMILTCFQMSNNRKTVSERRAVSKLI